MREGGRGNGVGGGIIHQVPHGAVEQYVVRNAER